ncbi:hypothetical protein [Rhizobium leguminosarum]|uniref:hypothetical protein n=1 Tax=Rhizobium leguminosarum TaxID=384 RepID=UPI0013F14EAE|nr:hypothetical protein [Rhizobium leguminosarum]MBY5494416.1 hypothetical protein [Rhizobium leguminosarum]
MDDLDATQAKDGPSNRLQQVGARQEHRKMVRKPIGNPTVKRYTQGAVQISLPVIKYADNARSPAKIKEI